MSVKIKISYQTKEELRMVVKCLQPLGVTLKLAKREDTKFQRAYITLK